MDMSVCMKVLENLEDSFNMAVSHYTEVRDVDTVQKSVVVVYQSVLKQ